MLTVVSGMIIVIDLFLMMLQFDPFIFQLRKVPDPDFGVTNAPNFRMNVSFSAEKNGDLLEMYRIDSQNLPKLPSNEAYTFSYQIDGRGFRNAEGQNLEDSDILVIGDSYTIASSLPLEKGWVSVLQKSTGKKVYQMATNQIGPKNYLHYLKFVAPQLKPHTKVLIAFFEGNDFANLDFQISDTRKKNLANFLRYFWENVKKFTVPTRTLDIPRFLISQNAGLQKSLPLLFLKNSVDDGLQNEEDFLQMFQPVELRDIFTQISSTCRAHLIDCHVIYFPEKFRVYFPLVQDQFDYEKYFSKIIPEFSELKMTELEMTENRDIQEILSEDLYRQRLGIREKWLMDTLAHLGLNFISLTDILSRSARENLIYWPYDTHLNGLGNEVAAREVAEKLF